MDDNQASAHAQEATDRQYGIRLLAVGAHYPTLFIRRQRANGDFLVIVESTVVRCVCFTAGIWYLRHALEASGQVWRGDRGPVAYGAAGISPAAMWRMRGASGQAAAKASRTR